MAAKARKSSGGGDSAAQTWNGKKSATGTRHAWCSCCFTKGRNNVKRTRQAVAHTKRRHTDAPREAEAALEPLLGPPACLTYTRGLFLWLTAFHALLWKSLIIFVMALSAVHGAALRLHQRGQDNPSSTAKHEISRWFWHRPHLCARPRRAVPAEIVERERHLLSLHFFPFLLLRSMESTGINTSEQEATNFPLLNCASGKMWTAEGSSGVHVLQIPICAFGVNLPPLQGCRGTDVAVFSVQP